MAAVLLGTILVVVIFMQYTTLFEQPDETAIQRPSEDQMYSPIQKSEKKQASVTTGPTTEPQDHDLQDGVAGQQSKDLNSTPNQQKSPTVSEHQTLDDQQTSEKQQTIDGQQTTDNPQTADNLETSPNTIGGNDLKSFFYEELTQEIKDRINGKSYGENCDVPYAELRYVKVLYWDFDGKVQEGELIVNKAIAQDIVDIFKELYDLKYPIEQMVLVDEYDADDNASMAADNSSAFNYRVVEGTSRMSLHSYGMAIDINPLYNPYVHQLDGETVVTPENGAIYEDRSLDCDYYIQAGDACYNAFIKRGFTWGGDWKHQKDYQHFQKAKEQ